MTKITVLIHQSFNRSYAIDCTRVYTGHMSIEGIFHQLDTRILEEGDRIIIEHHELFSDISRTVKQFVFEAEGGEWLEK